MTNDFVEPFLTIGALITYFSVMYLWCVRIIKKCKDEKEYKDVKGALKIEISIFLLLGGIIFSPLNKK